ncbi:MAG TPA: EscN/YscN/HrcN family type III secretion system ATPase, partial [Burkholderiaceae bacterium]|nr:EscN/YscN/HrcN family type III secretion system ATPase [Burkholderiaceae bacterium]
MQTADESPVLPETRPGPFDYVTELMQHAVATTAAVKLRGRVMQVTGTIIKAMVPFVVIGEICLLRNPGEA